MEGTVYLENGKVITRPNQSELIAIANLKPENIRAGVSVGGIVGSYVGEFVDSVLEHNSWAKIKEIIDAGHGNVWLGQTKTIESGPYQGYHFRLVDATPNRYEKVDGSGYTNAVFQMDELLIYSSTFPYDFKMNSDGSSGFWAWSDLNSKLNYARSQSNSYLSNLPQEIYDVIQRVKIGSGSGSGTSIQYANDYAFIPSEFEIMGEAINSLGASEGSPQYQYWAGKTASDRIKYHVDDLEESSSWWLRSPMVGSYERFCVINRVGDAGTAKANSSFYVAPCFAI